MHLRYASALLLTTLITAPAAAQWTTRSPVPTDLDVRGVAAPTPTRIFVATEDDSFDDGGALFESTDGGVTWTQRDVPTSGFSPLNGIFFLTDQLGWTYGNENYRTVDGGTTWEAMPFLGSTYFMEFHTPTFGFADTNGDGWVSRDGGVSWEVTPDSLFAFDFVSESVGLGAGPTGIYRTTDGGATFTIVQAGGAVDVAFLSPAVAVGIVDGTFMRSTDDGATWSPAGPAGTRNRLQAVGDSVVLAWRGTILNTDGAITRSEDGGQTWTNLGTVITGGTGAFAVIDATTVVASASTGDMFRSTNAGATWTQTYDSPGPLPSFLSSARPWFPDGQTGYYGYGGGFVIRTADAGATWSQVSSGYGRSLNDVARLADGTMLAAGEGGTLLRSADGMQPWQLQPALSQAHLVALATVGSTGVVVADEDARVYRSDDGGATWTPGASSAPGLDATDIHFSSLTEGWMVGSGFSVSALFRTTDGGDSWTPITGPAGLWVAIDFEGQSGWIVNIGGPFRRTVDGGETWVEDDLPDPTGFLSVTDLDFFDESVGYAVGQRGYVARSADGGVTWDILPTPNDTDDFTDIYLLGQNELWLSTRQDRVYYSANGGQGWAVIEIGSEGFGTFEAVAASPAGSAWTVGFQGYIEHFAGPPPPPQNRPPEASFTILPNRLAVSFTDTSTDPDGSVVGWAWDFGDGATSTERHPNHTYAAANTYIVSLTVTDDDGATGTGGRIIVVQAGPGGTFGDFTEVTPFEPYFVTPQDEDFWVATTAPADYDNDGDLDIAVLGYYVVYFQSVEEKLLLFRNDGPTGPAEWDFTYIDVPLGEITSGASDLAWADVDGDGDQDLAVGSDGVTVICRNDGGTLVITDTALPAYWEDNDQADFDLRSITFADYDNDGDPDLLIPSAFDEDSLEYRTALMRNDGPSSSGGWTFTEVETGLPATHHAQSAWADDDADGDLDLLLVNIAPLSDSAGFVRVYRNDAGSFTGFDPIAGVTVEHGEAQWGDYDSDGDLDILVAGHVRNPDQSFDVVLRIYRNDAGTYVPFEVIEEPHTQGWFDLTAATWADYDSDGDIDILLTGTYNDGTQISGRAKIYVNDAGVFTDSGNDLPAPRAGGTRGGTFTWMELDGDGDLDYFIAGDYWVPGGNGLIESQIHAYRNDAEGTNLAPTAPTNLNASVAGTSVSLTWNPALDDSTPQAQLTYELDLYRNGVPVALPERLPEPGDLSSVTAWSLAGLLNGAYSWTIRAVDTALNDGPAGQGTFQVGPVGTAPGPGGLPTEFALEGIYPNPFVQGTTIRYALPVQSAVVVTVFDLLGRDVATLEDTSRPAGYHEVRWDGSGAAVGTYLVRLEAGDYTATRTVTVAR
jgi:photosystem II stability/assembly factor-like uncharacterized protein